MHIPLNIAHRGGAQLWPENTRFAFVSAAQGGFDGAELDVQLTRDDRLVVFHDFRLKPKLCRDSDGSWLSRRTRPAIRALSFAELQGFDIGRPKPGTLYARRHPDIEPRDGETIPLLSGVLAAVHAVKRDFRFFVELKTSMEDRSLSAAPEAVAEAAIAELRAANCLAGSVLVGFDWRGLIHAKRIAPEATCWFTTPRMSRLGADAIAQSGGDGWFCSLNRAGARAVADARARNLAFGVWTVNQPRAMQKLIGLGVDAICTDRPDLAEPLLPR